MNDPLTGFPIITHAELAKRLGNAPLASVTKWLQRHCIRDVMTTPDGPAVRWSDVHEAMGGSTPYTIVHAPALSEAVVFEVDLYRPDAPGIEDVILSRPRIIAWQVHPGSRPIAVLSQSYADIEDSLAMPFLPDSAGMLSGLVTTCGDAFRDSDVGPISEEDARGFVLKRAQAVWRCPQIENARLAPGVVSNIN